ncbi:MAG TPA: hypothetical protein VKU86_01865 [Acidimicrobiales bacterium]|nr:hypothetical protein [Acidimicrobiales bacterium]
MSSLWTPSGEHRVGRDEDEARPAPPPSPPPSGPPRSSAPPPPPGAPSSDELGAPFDADMAVDAEEQGRQLEQLRRQIVGTPAEVVVANHVYGLFELAAIHLSQDPPGREQARLAVDAMGALVEGLAGRLGEAEPSLRDALAQIRLAYVQIGAQAGDSSEPG